MIQLFAAKDDAQIERRLLTPALTSMYIEDGLPYAAGFCIDGTLETKTRDEFGNQNNGPGQVCNTNPGDPSPRLTVSFPCALGLSKVVVTNRADWGHRIMDFALDVISSKGAVTHTYSFMEFGQQDSYTFNPYTLPGLCSSKVNPCGTGNCTDTSATTYKCSCPSGSALAFTAAGSTTCAGDQRAYLQTANSTVLRCTATLTRRHI